MRALLWFIALAATAVGLSIAARYNDGYALFVLPPWRVELSINLLALLILVLVLLLYVSMRITSAMLSLPASVQAFRKRQHELKAEAALRDAMRLLLEGRYGRALKAAERAYLAQHAPGLAALLAAMAAQKMRDDVRTAQWLANARLNDGEVHQARLMLEAEIAVDERNYTTADAALDILTKESGRHIAALRLALRTQQGLGKWQGVLRLLNQLEKHKAMTPDQAAVLRRRAHRANIRGLGGDADALRRYLRDVPAADMHEAVLAAEVARALMACDLQAEALQVIEDALSAQWDSSLVALYGERDSGDVLRRLSHAEAWLNDHPRDAQLLLTLGRLCRRRELWGKARSYAEASLSISPSREAHIELARLLDQFDKPDEANRHYRAAAETPC